MFQSITLDALVAAAASLFAGFMMTRPLHRAIAFGAAAFFCTLALIHSVPISLGIGALCAYGVFYSDTPAVQTLVPLAIQDPTPDWTVKDLFMHLDPRMLDEPHLSHWEVVGRALEDHLSVGRLKSWGRKCLGTLEDTSTKSTLVKIDSDYWEKGGKLSYIFFAEQYAAHTYPPDYSDLPEYADLQFNKAQCLGVSWPFLPTPRTIPIMEAARRVHVGTLGTVAARVAEGQKDRKGDPSDTVTWFCWAIWARAPLYGCRHPSTKLQEVSRHYRNTYSFAVEDGLVVLNERYGGGRFDQLQVLEDQMPKLIEVIGGIAEERA